MARPQPIRARAAKQSDEWQITIPPGWELRLRRVLAQVHADALPSATERGLSPAQRESRRQARRKIMQRAICEYIADVITSDIVGKEVALSTRNRYGIRTGSLREHVQAILRQASGR